jgi:roadblock/LC7 domain-containing protein
MIEMATTLDELVKIDGVAVAFEFAADGKIINHKAKMDVSSEKADFNRLFQAQVA